MKKSRLFSLLTLLLAALMLFVPALAETEDYVLATVNGEPMVCTLDGVLRGILAEGTPVFKGMKAGDIDPRCAIEHCYCASDKALAVGGGVLEAILNL